MSAPVRVTLWIDDPGEWPDEVWAAVIEMSCDVTVTDWDVER